MAGGHAVSARGAVSTGGRGCADFAVADWVVINNESPPVLLAGATGGIGSEVVRAGNHVHHSQDSAMSPCPRRTPATRAHVLHGTHAVARWTVVGPVRHQSRRSLPGRTGPDSYAATVARTRSWTPNMDGMLATYDLTVVWAK